MSALAAVDSAVAGPALAAVALALGITAPWPGVVPVPWLAPAQLGRPGRGLWAPSGPHRPGPGHRVAVPLWG